MSNFFSSSIGKKLMMSLAGLFLCSFLVVHLGINLLLLANDGGDAFRVAVHFMGTNPLIKVFEVVLFGGFLLHIAWGIALEIKNRISRPVGYKVSYPSQTSFFSKYMIHTGMIVFAFLGLHFVHFYFVKLGLTSAPQGAMEVADKHDFYNMAHNLFANPVYSWIYIGFMVFLAFHLHHAFQSAFQTLGLNHKRYTPIIQWAGIMFSIIIPAGFALIPIYFLYLK